MTRARKTKAQGASASRDASPTLRDEEELGAGGGQLVDPPAGQQQGEVAVVEQPVDNSMLAMMRDMLQQQNELMQRQMRTEREETVRRVENMLEPFRRQQQQPGQLSYRQQLQLQLEREQRDLQLRYEQQLAELPPEEGQVGAGLPPPPPPLLRPLERGAAWWTAATSRAGQPANPCPQCVWVILSASMPGFERRAWTLRSLMRPAADCAQIIGCFRTPPSRWTAWTRSWTAS